MTLLRLSLRLCVPILACSGLLADITSYAYDDAGRLTQVTYPNGTTINYTYDAAGNLLSRQVSSSAGSSTAKEKRPATRKNARKEAKHDN
jgi:YD repeat-containing protein